MCRLRRLCWTEAVESFPSWLKSKRGDGLKDSPYSRIDYENKKGGEGREATNDEPFEKQSTIKGVEPFGYSYLELERQIPRDFCPGKLHKFSRAVCHFLHALSLFPPVISTDRRGSLIYSLQSMAVPTWVEYKIEKSFDPGLLNVAVELFWVRIYIYTSLFVIDCSIRWEGRFRSGNCPLSR